MNPVIRPKTKLTRLYLLSFLSFTSLILSLTVVWQIGQAQQVQLSLADILIGLRSKKATLVERNKLLTDAVKERGITFALTPEIEKELETTGADKPLIEAIRQKSVLVKVKAPAPTPAPKPVATPVPTPTPPDSTFYFNRANSNFVKGDFDLAIVDYNKSIELNPKDTSSYLSRGMAYFNKKNYDLTIADYDKVIELNPTDAKTYFNRANSYEKLGNAQKAIDDFQKTVELDPTNETARASLQRLQAEQAKLLPEPKKTETPTVSESAKTSESAKMIPQSVELGQLNNMAVRLVTPVYPTIAQKMNIQGKVTVQITLDEEGKVTSAKASDGPSMLRLACENAARQSKFKPTMVETQAVKATGFIVYNFKGN